MTSSSVGISTHATDAVQVLVSLLSDESEMVREASASALKDIASLNPLIVLDCCSASSRGGRRRFGNVSGLFQVTAFGVRALCKKDVEPSFMIKLARAATSEIISSKEVNADWQRAAADLLVSIGSHLPDLMMEEVFLHLSGPSSSLPAMVQILADFASFDALQFTPRLKSILSRILPILGNVKDAIRPIFANAFKCWCQAVWQYGVVFPSHPFLDNDVMSFLNSAFELLLRVWATSRNIKVHSSSVEALGEMVGLISRTQLKSTLPRLIPTILELYRNDYETMLLATCSLHNLLNASLLSESGPPLLDYENLIVILSTLLPVMCINNDIKSTSVVTVGLKTYNEVQHCFLTIGLVYHDDLFTFLLNSCRSKEEHFIFGALCVLKHLLPRLSEAWHSKQSSLVETVSFLIGEQSLRVHLALSELILVMASHCYLVGQYGEQFVEYLVDHCSLPEDEKNDLEVLRLNHNYYPFQHKRLEVKFGSVFPKELRAVCEKGLLLLTITIPEMEHILWPFLLRTILPRSYSAAVATVCKCIVELCNRRSSTSNIMLDQCKTRTDIPNPEELFARLVVLLHDPVAREHLPTQIFAVLCHLAPLFPKNVHLFWQDEIPKLKSYVSDTEDLKQDPSYQETWDNMIINFLSETLDVIQDPGFVFSLGNAFTEQYVLYAPDDEHAALLHRCLGMLLQKVNDRTYVRDKINWMYKQANIAFRSNMLGLAKAMGLVAASHLDVVLEKLRYILDNVNQTIFQRIFHFLSYRNEVEDSDDIHAALALMYGYAARYAPSTVIEARIDALVGTNMLSRLLNVRHPSAKQAVITAIDLLGSAVINAAKNGESFPLKRRDEMLHFILTLMGGDDNDGFTDASLDHLQTQTLALSACTTLVSVEPKLTTETRNLVMKETLGFFALPNDPAEIVTPLINNLITLLCAILHTSGQDGRIRSELLLHILSLIDNFVCSTVEDQRKRGCLAVKELLVKFRSLCISGHCSLGCHGFCLHGYQVDRTVNINVSNLAPAIVYPSRDSLCLGERILVYLPRCADTNAEVRKFSAQILDQFFSICISLPRPTSSTYDKSIELSYHALSSLEDVIAILESDASIDPSEVFNRVVSSVCVMLTLDELVVTLHCCATAICDKIKQSAEGSVQSVIEFVAKRGNELNDMTIAKTTQSLLSAAGHVTEKHLRLETLGAISFLAESTTSGIVFREILMTAGKDIVTKDISRLRGGWHLQDAFFVFSQNTTLSFSFLEHLISILNQTSVVKGVHEIGDCSNHFRDNYVKDETLQAAILAITAYFRGGGKIGRKAVEQNYASVLSALLLQFGSCYVLASYGQHEPLWAVLTAFQAFCEYVGDLEMGRIMAGATEQTENEGWIDLIGDVAGCISIKRPKEVPTLCLILTKSLNQHHAIQREAAAAALSQFIRYCDGCGNLLEQMVEALCRHVLDESPTVKRLCLRGLIQIPLDHIHSYTHQILGVILKLLKDSEQSVQLTAVSCLLMVMKSSNDALESHLLNLSVQLRNLQLSMVVKMRADAFEAFGVLCKCGLGAQHNAFLDQVHAVIPPLVLHLHDEDQIVRLACQNTFTRIAPFMGFEGIYALLNTHSFHSEHRSDYEKFVRGISRLLLQHLAPRLETYMTSTIQAFEAPWPTIQANAIHFSTTMLSLSDDHHMLNIYYTQVFQMLVDKMSRSADAIVRATCSSALSLLLKSPNLVNHPKEVDEN